MKYRKGDTLIEVMLAVGIFSMVAVVIVSVMSSGTSGAQTALETTLAREEIDAQAEALRFIHSAYISNKSTEDTRYSALWKSITKKAVNNRDLSNFDGNILQYTPSDCSSLYDVNGEAKLYGFVIDYRQLGNTNAKFDAPDDDNSVLFTGDASSKLQEATTYPRLTFSKTEYKNETVLADDLDNSNLYKAEGIYVIVVKDTGGTQIVYDDNLTRGKSAFYDFYIRTCWYGTDATQPSTISTVIRLYNPDIVDEVNPNP
ncbi:hypothetical protein IKG33_02355 [Candidatus Saccharibacteria bacterium]|nr:hypothetical protein [Candidatus Saccharibacteria bacterium]